ncbi:MAG TPA: hemerythrin domain-containing protein [Albitalea sp.]
MDATAVLGKLSPSITKMIRMDHSHAMVTAHKFTADAPPDKKKAIVTAVCRALEVHAQLEEEIFYPALREVCGDDEVLRKAQPEHDEMKRLIGELRGMEPSEMRYDQTFMSLMRQVMHHVADEEAVLLPAAEKQLGHERLCALGAQMTKRRMQLVTPHAGEMATATARAMPAGTMLVAGGLLTGAYLISRGLSHRRHH